MRRLIDLVAPPHLGGSFRALLGSQWATNFADGLAIAAGPLLVASDGSGVFFRADNAVNGGNGISFGDGVFQ